MFREGTCLPLYIQGDRFIGKVLTEYSWSTTIARSGSFLCTAASSTSIREVRKEVRYIHRLSLTLEHSMPISSPAAPDLTSPRALRSRVLQASSTCRGVFEYFNLSKHPSGDSGLPLNTSSSPPSTSGCFKAMRCSSPENLIIYSARSSRAPYGVAPEP